MKCKGLRWKDKLNNNDIKTELRISSLQGENVECRTKWTTRLKKIEKPRILLQAFKYNPDVRRHTVRSRIR
jgi:hypothetical protein